MRTYSKFNHIWAQVKSTMKVDRSQLLTDPHLCSSPQSSPALAALTHHRTHVEFHVVAHDARRGLHRHLLVGPQSPACYSPQSLALHAVAAPACSSPESPPHAATTHVLLVTVARVLLAATAPLCSWATSPPPSLTL